jgi:DNA-binding CsgD family transcriptional regulator
MSSGPAVVRLRNDAGRAAAAAARVGSTGAGLRLVPLPAGGTPAADGPALALALREAAGEHLGTWSSVTASAPGLLSDVARALGADLALLWMRESDSGPLTVTAAWGAARPSAGRRLAARAWAVAAPIVDDELSDVGRGRRPAVAIPAVRAGESVAVLTFELADRGPSGPHVRLALRDVGRELGRALGAERFAPGAVGLSPREAEVLQMAADGHDGPAIAERLVVSPATVKTHFVHIYAKLGVTDRASAVAFALRRGLIA